MYSFTLILHSMTQKKVDAEENKENKVSNMIMHLEVVISCTRSHLIFIFFVCVLYESELDTILLLKGTRCNNMFLFSKSKLVQYVHLQTIMYDGMLVSEPRIWSSRSLF